MSARARAGQLTADQAAVLLLEFVQSRECGGHAERLRIARIHPANNGIDRVIQKFNTEAPAHESRNRFLGIRCAARDERLSEQP